MELKYQQNGNLEEGVYTISWEKFVAQFGSTIQRMDIIKGLKMAMEHLAVCGCPAIYIDGSFVTKERNPSDFDACWDNTDKRTDFQKLYIDYKILSLGTKEQQQLIYKGDIRPANSPAQEWGDLYIQFFQKDKQDKSPKGIIKLILNEQ